MLGQSGNDKLFAHNGGKDFLDGGTGFDTAKRDNGPTILDQVKNVERFI